MLEEKYDGLVNIYAENRGNFPIVDILEMYRLNMNFLTGRMLDLGCGTGYPVCEFFLSRGWSVTGVDVSSKMLEIAKNAFPTGFYIKARMEDYDMGENKFEAISAVYSLFHIPFDSQSRVFSNVYKALKERGKFLFTYATKEYTKHEEFSGTMRFMDEELPYFHKSETDLIEELESIGFSVDIQAKIEKGGERFLWMVVSK